MTTSKRLTTLYIQDSLRAILKQVSAKNNRSMNAQIIHILENDIEVKSAINGDEKSNN